MKAIRECEGALSLDKYEVRDVVSCDKFICQTPGQLSDRYGQGLTTSCFQEGTIYNDAVSGLIWVKNQVSLGANERVMGRACFEQLF